MSKPKQWVWRFDESIPDDLGDATNLLGGKGAMLNQLTRAGYRVPPGFTISTAACQYFLNSQGDWPDELWEQVVAGVTELERRARRSFGRGNDPLLLAVRGGAPVSMPGMLDTILRCGAVGQPKPPTDRQTTRKKNASEKATSDGVSEDPWQMLRQAIEQVFVSWQGERALRYRQVHGIEPTPGTAVNIQVMVDTRRAGVLFTRDPLGVADAVPDEVLDEAIGEIGDAITGDGTGGRMIIESVAGLGDTVVGGQQTPDRIEVARQSGAIRSAAFMEATLKESEVRALVELGCRLERQLGTAVDLEWGLDEEGLVIFQARPLLPGPRQVDNERLLREELDRLRGTPAAEGPTLWVRHNLHESLPTPTPLTWDLARYWMSGAGGLGQLYRDLGYRPSAVAREQGFLELVFGRIYAVPNRVAEMFYPGLPFRYDLPRLCRNPELLNQAPDQLDPDAADNRLLFRLPGMLWTLWRAGRRLRRLPGGAVRRFEQHVVPEFLEYVDRERQRDLASLDHEALCQLLDERRGRVLGQFAAEFLRPGLLGGLALTRLQHELTELLGPDAGLRISLGLLSGLDAGDCDLQLGLQQLAARRIDRDEFLERFGHRGPVEMELAAPRWRESLADLPRFESALRAHLSAEHSPGDRAERQRREAERELESQLASNGASSLRPVVWRLLREARQLLPYREKGRHYLMMGYELLRQVIQELAERNGLDREIYFLKLEELRTLPDNPRQWKERAARRRQRWQVLQRVTLPEVIESDRLEDLLSPRVIDGGRPFQQGTPLSGGTARGHAVLLATPDSLVPVTAACVLVCPTVDPAYTPWLLSAAGLIVERGGMLSHGAIVARQLGIPAVVCPGALSTIPAGATVVVDGDSGRLAVETT